MAENISATSRTRHVDTRYNFVRVLVKEGFVKMTSVRSTENYSEGFTKNVSTEICITQTHQLTYKNLEILFDLFMGG